jgi:lysophospholipase L1-like esterase
MRLPASSWGKFNPFGSVGAVLGTLTPGQLATFSRLTAAATAAVGNNPVDLADMASPPTITQSATHNAALTVVNNVALQPANFWLSPVTQYLRTSNNAFYSGTSNFGAGSAATNLSSLGASLVPTALAGGDSNNSNQVGFVTSAPDVEINLRVVGDASTPYRFIVNGQYVARAGLDVTQAFVTLSFGSSAARTIIIECPNGQPFLQVAAAVGNTFTAPSTGLYSNPCLAIAYGDSITEAISGGDAIKNQWANWFATMCTQSGIAGFRNAGVGATGYTNTAAGTRSKCLTQMPFTINGSTWDLIAFMHGFNDYNQFALATVLADALACWQYARAQQPNAFIEVYGIPGEGTGPSTAMKVVENAMLAQFNAWGDKFSVFIPNSTDPAGAWITGTGRVGATNGTGNSDIYLSSDGVHPSQPAGQVYIGGRANTSHRSAIGSFGSFELREDGSFELREDGTKEVRQ